MKKTTKRKVKTGRVTSIGLSRLYNTGNYTNLRIDLTCQIEKGESAKATMMEMVRILSDLRPGRPPECLHQLKEARKQNLTERSEYVKNHFPDWVKQEEQWHVEQARRRQAIEDLDRLGGRTEFVDHKLRWEDDDTPF